MENKTVGNKTTPNLNSPSDVQEIYRNPDQTVTNSSPPNASKTAGYATANSSIDNKMNNVAKLRQQFVEEIKNIELSLKVCCRIKQKNYF
jgi:hypothetical protein